MYVHSPLATTVIIAATFALRSSQPIDGVVIARIARRTATCAFFFAVILMGEARGYHQEARANDDDCLHVGVG